MNTENLPIVLGSASPMRLTLLKNAGFEVAEVLSVDLDETEHKKENPRDYCLRVTKEKFIAVSKLIKTQKAILITSDTTGIVGKKFLHKTDNDEVIRKYMHLISGKKHKVITSICCGIVINNEIQEIRTKTVESTVSVKRMHDKEIEFYVRSKQGLGKAGGCTLQGIMARYITEINGSFSSILGLPLYETSQLLNSLGYR